MNISKFIRDRKILYSGIGVVCILLCLCFYGCSSFDKKEFYNGVWKCKVEDMDNFIYSINLDDNRLAAFSQDNRGQVEKFFDGPFTIIEEPGNNLSLIFEGYQKPTQLIKDGEKIRITSEIIQGPNTEDAICVRKK